MNIIILGAGQVGSSVAENLASEANDITLVDTNPVLLNDLSDRLDIQTIVGHASHPDVLKQAGISDADMLVAVTNSDETNIVACQIAYSLFHTPTKIARVRSHAYLKYNELFNNNALPIDVLISPEHLIAEHIQRLIEYPGALQVMDFAGGRARLVGVKAYYGGTLVGHEIAELRKHIPAVDSRVAAIFRRGKGIVPDGHQVIEADDEVFFIAARKDIRVVMSELRKLDKPIKSIMLAGGGNIGKSLAQSLEHKFHVKLIDRNTQRARQLSYDLNNTIVLLGDAADESLLLEENIEQMDVFCALTNDDEANILSSMLAKRLGARKVMSLINRHAYVDLMESEGAIDVAISPQQITISGLLAHVRRGDVVAVHSLRRGAAEAIEAIAHGDSGNSKVVGKSVADVRLPEGTTIGAIIRGEEVIMAHHDVVIENEDHLILFLLDKKKFNAVEKLFQVGVTFF
ncbi:MAG: Trk system potassium transporter TrkA [Gammaproteobacteria bacterium]|jgi:trk system potassium uptake protein TrkA|nr:Trk system potassium transporter TrkA [Gammaproteobacteria bacterium]